MPTERNPPPENQEDSKEETDFDVIWNIGVFDAHCHPVELMQSIDEIPDMKARVLAVMSTRGQDQELTESVAKTLGLESQDGLESFEKGEKKGRIVPAFGWHPWFSHLLYDDTGPSQADAKSDTREHYKKVLHPDPDDHFLNSLSDPIPLSQFLKETEERLLKYPLALIGEIGLDRSFRIPEGPRDSAAKIENETQKIEGSYTPGSREGRRLTPYKVIMEHQKTVLKAQLQLAAKHKRPVSVHSVQAHGIVFEVLQSLFAGHQKLSKRQLKKLRDNPDTIADEEDKAQMAAAATNSLNGNKEGGEKGEKEMPFPPRICMHSFSGSHEALKMFIDPKHPAEMFVSFSEVINFSTPASKKAEQVIKAMPDDKILVESDLHTAGESMDRMLEGIVRKVCDVKGWELEDGAKRLRRNWERFVFG